MSGESEAESEFHLWLLRKMDRSARALERKANRLAACSVIARPMDCIDCGLKAFLRFYCGNRYCRYCGNQIFLRLFAKYIRLQEIVNQLMLRDGFRPKAVLATFTFTTARREHGGMAAATREPSGKRASSSGISSLTSSPSVRAIFRTATCSDFSGIEASWILLMIR
jgi:hypothetical protein